MSESDSDNLAIVLNVIEGIKRDSNFHSQIV